MNDDFDKYLVIANHDIQKANNMEELKSYVASILYEMDNLGDRLKQKENIIKEVREYIEENTKWYDKELGLVEMKGYKTNRIPVIYLYGLLRILDKENI